MSRRKIAAGNWKMNTTVSEGLDLVNLLGKFSVPADVDVIICAPFTHLHSLVSSKPDFVKIGAQNVSNEDKGAFTGEISPIMIKDLGVEYVIIGHSERREYFGETNQLLAKKLDKALEHGLTPIFCCGEPLEIRKKNDHIPYVKKQLEEGLFHLSDSDVSKVILAYEPIWAIGTGETATPEQAQETHAAIRSLIKNQYSDAIAQVIPILYGGSVKPNNAQEIFSQTDVDGGLVGGASLNAEGFAEIANAF